jgi:hypothetical protein
MKYLYLVCIVLNHFIFSCMLTLYALLLYCSLCEPGDAEDNRANRWKFFNSQVCNWDTLLTKSCPKIKYKNGKGFPL